MKHHFIWFLIGILLFGFGCAYLWFEVLDYDYIDAAPKSEYIVKEEEYRFNLEDGKKYAVSSNDAYVRFHIDNTLDGTVRMVVRYYPEFGSVFYSTSDAVFGNGTYKQIRFQVSHQEPFRKTKEFLTMLKNDIKEKQMHNYTLFFIPQVEVYVSGEDRDKLDVRGLADEFSAFFEGSYHYVG